MKEAEKVRAPALLDSNNRVNTGKSSRSSSVGKQFPRGLLEQLPTAGLLTPTKSSYDMGRTKEDNR
jgi:hypothetical protein